ncbi:hypothetical protein TRFO_11701 [Tritrichomonas foetus]|uniref:Uncharacterized protein n=1 Tax=Tritrichomonas foetus TaxID=1144522 RepID=A0A1J4J776_9EUKA|nr:hypothetical protein TRFO_11701 [Tritrichomonas foetus]|eukprot:OHS93507.1 hypothetical protein TRFO_11701 [Tritrichomonas foetus]
MSYKNWSTEDVVDQLNSHGFGYAATPFSKNAISGDLLPMVTEDHLKEMGISSIGKRLLLLQWIRDTAGNSAHQSKPPRQQRVDFGGDDYEPPPSKSRPDPPSASKQQAKPAAKRAQTAAAPASENVPKCKRDHDKMVEQIHAARKLAAYQKAVEEGRAVGPPPELPPIEEPEGLVRCPHCGRKFGDEAAKHHIPVCERMMYKKNNPPRRK